MPGRGPRQGRVEPSGVNRRLAPIAVVLAVLVAAPAHAASNPKTGPTQLIRCPDHPDRTARIWVELGKRWTADNQCGHGVWLSIGWGATDSTDSEEVLVAPKTRFGPRKSGSLPAADGWWGARLTTNPEFCDGETYVVWPNSKGRFDPVC